MNKLVKLIEKAQQGEIDLRIDCDAGCHMIEDETYNALEAILCVAEDGLPLEAYYAEPEADVYMSDLHRWLQNDRFAPMWCENAVSELGWEGVGKTVAGMLNWGQYMQKRQIHYCVVEALKRELEDLPDEYVMWCNDCDWIAHIEGEREDVCQVCGSENLEWDLWEPEWQDAIDEYEEGK